MINLKSLRRLLLAAHLVILTGYSVGLFYVHETDQTSPGGIEKRLNGDESSDSLSFPMEMSSLIVTTHNHMINLGMLFMLVSVVYIATNRYKNPLLKHIYLELFVSVFLTFGSLWAIRLVDPVFKYVAFVSGVIMHSVFYFICFSNMYFLGRFLPKKQDRHSSFPKQPPTNF